MKDRLDATLQHKIKPLRILILDVDGVMTDGGIVFDDQGNESKKFDVRDGHGIKLLMRTGVTVIILTGRTSQAVAHRAFDLGISEVYQGVKNKLAVFEQILKEKNILPDAVAYVGDDVVDIPVLRRVGFAATVADGSHYVKDVADYITEREGGRGAVREICELIMKARGQWSEVTAKYELT